MRALRRNDAVRTFTVAFAVIAAVVAVSCDRVPLTSPTGSTIQLSTSTSIVPIDGSAEITATVIESAGTAVQNGTTVVFRADLGRMDPPESQTVNGRAVSRFFASGLSGVAKINAYSGAAATGGTAPTNSSAPAPSSALTLLVGGAAASRISVRAEPPNIPQTGGTIQIFASVADVNGSPVNGAPVAFTITNGTGGSAGSGVLGSPSTQTNASGVAQTSLTTNQTTTVTATVVTANVVTGAVTTANVVITALAAPTVAISGCTAAQSVGVAVNCTITPTVSTGGAPIQNLTVNWGDGSGEQPLGGTGATSASHVYTAPGTYTMTAATTDLNSQRGTASLALVVSRVLPNVVLTLPSPSTGTVGVPVAMSIAPASTQTQLITGVVIDFGDGTSRTFGQLTSAQGFTKTYTSAGGFTVSATATDASGQQGTTSQAIVISRGVAPTVTLTPPSPINRNQPATFTVAATGGVTPMRSVTVTMTDGTVLYSGTTLSNFVYTFLGSGNTVLTAVVVDATGAEGRTQVAISILP